MIGREYVTDLAVPSSSLVTSSSVGQRRGACSASFGIDQLLGLAADGPDDVTVTSPKGHDVIVTSSPRSQSEAAAAVEGSQLQSACRCPPVNLVEGWTKTSAAAAAASVSSSTLINTAWIDCHSHSPVTVMSCRSPPLSNVVEDWTNTSSSSSSSAAAALDCAAVRSRLGLTVTSATSSHCTDSDLRPSELPHRIGTTAFFLPPPRMLCVSLSAGLHAKNYPRI